MLQWMSYCDRQMQWYKDVIISVVIVFVHDVVICCNHSSYYNN